MEILFMSFKYKLQQRQTACLPTRMETQQLCIQYAAQNMTGTAHDVPKFKNAREQHSYLNAAPYVEENRGDILYTSRKAKISQQKDLKFGHSYFSDILDFFSNYKME